MLTPAEAKVLHEVLKNQWAPSRGYAEFISAVKKLEAMAQPGAQDAGKDGGHRGS